MQHRHRHEPRAPAAVVEVYAVGDDRYEARVDVRGRSTVWVAADTSRGLLVAVNRLVIEGVERGH